MQGLLRTVVLLLSLVVVLVAILFLVPTTGDSSRVIAVVRLRVRVRPSELLTRSRSNSSHLSVTKFLTS